MSIDPGRLAGLVPQLHQFHYGFEQARLYALATGYASDGVDPVDLAHVIPGSRPAVPATFATVLAAAGAGMFDEVQLKQPELAVHIEQRLRMFDALPPAGAIELTTAAPKVFDRGPDRGALIHLQVTGRLAGSDRPLFDTTYVSLARGDGGFAGEPQDGARLPSVPERESDHRIRTKLASNQALIYALTGDDNPIHLDPAAAAAAGFERPILHGLCSYGVAARAVSKAVGSAFRLTRFDVRFSAPMLPGETMITQIWRDGASCSFRAWSSERGVVVLDNGVAEFEPSA